MKYVIWIREGEFWRAQGDGPLTLKTAERIVRELKREIGGRYVITPEREFPSRRHLEVKRDDRGQWMYRVVDGGEVRVDWQYGPHDLDACVEQAGERFGGDATVIEIQS